MDYARESKVRELSRILPMVRKSIEKERKINQLKKERRLKIDELEKIEVSVKRTEILQAEVKRMPDVQAKIKGIDENLTKLKHEQQSKKESLNKELSLYNETIDMLENEWIFEHQLFQSIVSVLATEKGFLEEAEVNEDFLKEYIYLLSMNIDYAYKQGLKVETLLKEPKAIDKFYELIEEKFDASTANKIEALLEGDRSVKYFDIF